MNSKLKAQFEAEYEYLEDISYAIRLNYKRLFQYASFRFVVSAMIGVMLFYVASKSPNVSNYIVSAIFVVFILTGIATIFNVIKSLVYFIFMVAPTKVLQNKVKYIVYNGHNCRNVPNFIEPGDKVGYIRDFPFRRYYFMRYK